MKWVVGGLFLLGATAGSRLVAAQNSGSAPPTAQFPPADAAPGAGAHPETAAPSPHSSAPSATAPAAVPPGPASASPAAAAATPSARPALPPPHSRPIADATAGETERRDDSPDTFSLTLSPLHLIGPILQLTGELRVVPHFGVSLIAGYGELGVDTTDIYGSRESVKVSVYELGGRAIAYPLENFRSLQVGAQLLYLHVATDDLSDVSATGAGFALGPFIGYKVISDVGFTFLAQGGFQYLAARADAHDTDGNSASESDSRFLPLLNLDVGWSF